MKIVLEAVLENLSTRQDGSVKISLATQELDPSKGGDLFQLRNRFIKVLLSDNNINPIEERLVDETEISGGKKAKSSSQRLRAIMFRLHENQGISQDFDQWYKTEMERIIDNYKEALNQLT